MPGNYFDKSRMDLINTFENNFKVNLKFTIYLKESCKLDFNQDFVQIYYLKIPFVSDINKISPNLSGNFMCYRHELVK